MTNGYVLFAGIDYGSEFHQVCLLDREGGKLAEFRIEHSAKGVDGLVRSLLQHGHSEPNRCAVAIELTHSAVIETLLERGFQVFAINPKQLDRFRDRYTAAGSKDDRLDAFVQADSLRTDARHFRQLQLDEPLVIRLRELSRVDSELQKEFRQLASRLRALLHRFFPQLLKLCPAADEAWLWALLLTAPTPHQARRLRKNQLSRILREHRIRRISSEQLRLALREPSFELAPGSLEAACEHTQLLLPRLQLVNQQLRDCRRRIDEVLQELCREGTPEGESQGHRDAEILLSIPGAGRIVGATMLSEASQPLAQRDYHTLRAHTGIAPVTRRSGKTTRVLMRRACNPRLREAVYHWSRTSIQNDDHCRAFYARQRALGHSHARALRALGDRLLRILIAALRTQSLYDPSRRGAHSS
ncbi:MAG TPA: IS110 family transposase [Acidimicrobiia bacterium]